MLIAYKDSPTALISGFGGKGVLDISGREERHRSNMAGRTTHRPCRILHDLNPLPPSIVTKGLLVLQFTQHLIRRVVFSQGMQALHGQGHFRNGMGQCAECEDRTLSP